MREEVVNLVLNPRLVSRIPSTTQRAVDSTRALMLQGEFSVPNISAAAR
jgi:hypothetical protein